MLRTRIPTFFVLFLVACSAAAEPPSPTAIPSVAPTRAQETQPPASNESNVNRTTSGTITKDETWRGVIHITGDIRLQGGATLTIEPGTTVYLASNSDDRHTGDAFDDEYTRDHNDPVRLLEWSQNAIVIDGRSGVLIIIGTAQDPITFRPEGDSTSPAQWEGILIEQGTIRHAIVLYGGRTAIQPLGNYGNIEIAYNEVRFFHWAGIDAKARNVWIHDNIVEGGGHQAIGITAGTVVEHNLILNSQSCIGGGGVDTIVRNNLMVDCARGVQIYGGESIEVSNNTIVRVQGPPTGWYYQGQLIYPAFVEGGGVELYAPMQVTIFNNVISGGYSWAIGLHSTPVAGSVVDYNLFWGTGDRYAGSGSSFAGAHNQVSDPMFVNAADLDFHLALGSPAIDSGSPDILDADSSPSDVGAYGGLQAAEIAIEASAFPEDSAASTDRVVHINLFCNCTTTISQKDIVNLEIIWGTAEEEQAAQISDAAHVELLIEGQTMLLEGDWDAGVQNSGNGKSPFSRHWRSSYDFSSLAPGQYQIEVRLVFDKPTSDGESEFAAGDVVSSIVVLAITE